MDVNKAAQTLARMGRGKPKKMTPAAMKQRREAAQASAVARRKRKRSESMANAKTNFISKPENSACVSENAPVELPHDNTPEHN